MKALLAVAYREIQEKRFIFVAAAVASLLPFAVPVARGLHGTAAQDARDLLVSSLAIFLMIGLGVACGVSIWSSQVADRRVGFYFASARVVCTLGGKTHGRLGNQRGKLATSLRARRCRWKLACLVPGVSTSCGGACRRGLLWSRRSMSPPSLFVRARRS